MGTGTSVGRVRGLGSAKHGSHHWWHQRLTAASNLLLVTWLFVSLLRLPLYNYRALALWIGSPWVSVPLVLVTISIFYHLRLGLQVVIEDYQHDFTRVIALVALNFYAIGGAALAIFAILKVAFTGALA
ncbi:succinate dehydrogenase, hydrophobic membrane anchor protein [Sphingomonas nostoxanthinifaciens]|uniref:succinate dehydrogenase, hydrophobic membrane anchor protein n=1 Tax=Sphingomonas nostoxanthinifaciens TaxID=2872652 RepID=UPI001CC1E0EF|nr:succinate dehydrogenase, hydrophobic membrane anchor protein [Sphingomonas nostoxanthinifaciens]UAK25971.1 succinate dehydrogenase, hydrophobic membrane anchor protein [Sphingomonas nostoxanthinifaciens]